MAGHHRVFVLLGFHVNFYHSWRGDTPDEAGFGPDIRVIRQILHILEGANAAGLAACGYWDWDVYWTLQEIIPKHAPDILDAVRRRVERGLDEIVLGPYNNGANHAATAREFRTALAWAIENPFGSGLKQLFGQVAPIYRPQEFMYTAGQNAILLEQGVRGVILAYAGIPFNSLSTFIPPLRPEHRYNPLWLRCQPGEPPVNLLPCISILDLLECGGLEALLLHLRGLQKTGALESDVAVHINFDADNDAWLPLRLPRFLGWLPNSGGLQEYIRVVNKYPWAEFGLPSRYLEEHPPQVGVLVRQDLADGGFDGSYSWAEKYTSLLNWTEIERSRLAGYRTEALCNWLPGDEALTLRRKLWQGPDSAFFQRLIGLSSTHFGMSTPVINEERQSKAVALLRRSSQVAGEAERAAAALLLPQQVLDSAALYRFNLYLPSFPDWGVGGDARPLVRLPLLLPEGVQNICLENDSGRTLPFSWVNVQPFAGGRRSGELLFLADLPPGAQRSYSIRAVETDADPPPMQPSLRNRWLDLRLSPASGIESIRFEGQPWAGAEFLEPFLSYRLGKTSQAWGTRAFRLEPLPGEQWDGCRRACLATEIVMHTEDGPFTSRFCYTFTLFDEMPFVLVDVEADYARTPARDVVHTLEQKLRRRIDRRWVETAPFQLNLPFTASGGSFLHVWKHNFMGVTASYEADYGQVNPVNKNLDSFNHQVTAGWVAVSNGQAGLLLAESAESLASMAFCPMRLREAGGVQSISLNPFGSYYGRQLDYAHLEGSGVGAEVTLAGSIALRPNGPSYNGQTLRFSLLLAPYSGDQPPVALQEQARSFFYPPGVFFTQAPFDGVLLPEDIVNLVAVARCRDALASADPLPPPLNFLANPSNGAVDLVWEEPRDLRLAGYEVRWRPERGAEWQRQRVPPCNRWQVDGLVNGQRYRFQARSVSEETVSPWTSPARAVPGAVLSTNLFDVLPEVSPGTLFKLVAGSLRAAVPKNKKP